MKIAVFHNFMDNIGGAEIVTLIIARKLNADIYTTNIDNNKIIKMGFKDVLPRIKSLGKISKKAPFRHQLALHKFRKLNLGKKYDSYIISGDWAMSGAVNNKPNLWYIHSPLNELWAFKDYIRNYLLTAWKKPLFDLWVLLNRYLTRKYAKNIDKWICNSNNTKERIKKYYKKNAIVINPPIDNSLYKYNKNKNYWLSVNRLVAHKRIEIQMKAFAKLPKENLIIVGSYEKGVRQFELYKKFIEKIKPSNVKITNWASLDELKSLYANCKGFIATARDEDFGMTPVESMASGKPVIAIDEGGYKETIIDKETGILINNINEKKLIEAIKKLGKEINKNPLKFKKKCQKQAEKFDIKIFIKKIKKELNYI